MTAPRRRFDAGFTLIDIMITLGVFAIVTAAAVPAVVDMTSNMRVAQGARDVERELQTARLRAVGSNRPMRMRFNCPVAGQYRMVELIGSTSAPDALDSAASRCNESTYPYPASDNNPLTRPNNDGPVRRLPAGTAFGAASTLEFWPDGSVHQNNTGANPWPVVGAAGTSVTVTKGTVVKTVTVNGLGKIQLQQ